MALGIGGVGGGGMPFPRAPGFPGTGYPPAPAPAPAPPNPFGGSSGLSPWVTPVGSGGGGGGFPPPPFGGWGGPPPPVPGPGSGGGAGTPPPDLSNITGDDPNLQYLVDQYKSRLGSDPTQRAMDRAASEIRDTASGIQSELGSNLAARGMLGTGVENELRTRVGEQAQRAIGKSSADISLGREKDLDQLVMGGLGLMRAPSELALSRQGLGLRQWEAQNQGDIARQRMDIDRMNAGIQQQTAMADLWSKYLSMFF